jgi:hypothetical protein
MPSIRVHGQAASISALGEGVLAATVLSHQLHLQTRTVAAIDPPRGSESLFETLPIFELLQTA